MIPVKKTLNERISFIDVWKGIGIILVMLGHCIGDVQNPINKIILAFHMPMFFMISGFLHVSEYDVEKYFARKVKSLLVPVIIYEIINICIRLLCTYVNPEIYSIISLKGFWFILSLLYVSIACCIFEILVSKKIRTEVNRDLLNFIISTLLLIVAYLYSRVFNDTTSYYSIGCIGLFFYNLGYIFKKYVFGYLINLNKVLLIIISAAILLAVSVISQINTPILMYINNYGNLALFLISAVLGSISMLAISLVINKNIILEFYGRNSLVILITHFAVYNSFGILLRRARLDTWLFIVILFIITIGVEFLIVKISNKYLPFLKGKIDYIKEEL